MQEVTEKLVDKTNTGEIRWYKTKDTVYESDGPFRLIWQQHIEDSYLSFRDTKLSEISNEQLESIHLAVATQINKSHAKYDADSFAMLVKWLEKE